MSDDKTIFQVDAFTDEPFKGNPAGVMIINKNVATEWMQNIAAEMNLSETAFIIPGKTNFQIRYFTPLKEVPLCGHATLACAHIVYEVGLIPSNESFKFKAKGGNLKIAKELDWIVMNIPQYPLMRINVPKYLKEMIGFEPIEVYSSKYDWIIAIAKTKKDILKAEPEFEMLKRNGLGHLMITSESEMDNFDFVVRCFCPAIGINEDPVTGSAHCALTPLWSKKLRKIEMDSLQLSKRTGKLKIKLVDAGVEIKGKALTVFEAQLRI